jgi:CRP-like cAMP-binding protein
MDFKKFFEKRGQVIHKDINDHLFQQGDMDVSLYYIKTGLLKAYYITEDGKEFVKSFLLADSVITNLISSHLKEPCSYSVVCLEPSTLIKVAFEELYKCSRENQSIGMTMIDVLLKLALKKERREYEFLCLSAEKRYWLLQENKPELLEKVTQNDIARYLGITPVALSRIKNRQ